MIKTPSLLPDLLDSIYAAAVGEHGWEHTIAQLGDAFRSPAAGFFVQHSDNHEFSLEIFQGVSDTDLASYATHFSEVNPWFTTPGMMLPGLIRSDEDINIHFNHCHHFVNTEYYQDWLKPQDLKHSIGGTLTIQNGYHLNFTFMRPAQSSSYKPEEIELLQTLFPHLSRAFSTSRLLETVSRQQQNLLDGCDRFKLGLVLFDNLGKITDVNQSALKILLADDGLGLRRQKLWASHPGAEQHIHATLHAMLSPQSPISMSQWLHIPRLSGAASYQLMVITHPSPLSALGPRCKGAMLLVDPARRRKLPRHRIQAHFALTVRETDVAQLMIQGYNTKELAHELDITYESARTYVKRICQKANVNGQTAFVALTLKELALIF